MTVCAASLALASAACADGLEGDDSALAADALEQAAPGAPTDTSFPELTGPAKTVPNPSGLYVASVRANGSGCSAGTWDARISDDGLAFTLTFSGYEIVATEKTPVVQTKNCAIALEMSSPSGLSFGVQSLHYDGYAFLPAGMSAEQNAYYTFAGSLGSTTNLSGPGVRQARHPLTGPFDDPYVFSDEVNVSDTNYSECAKSATLLVNTRLVLNNPKRQGGQINVESVNGETTTKATAKLRVNLRTRPCPAKK